MNDQLIDTFNQIKRSKVLARTLVLEHLLRFMIQQSLSSNEISKRSIGRELYYKEYRPSIHNPKITNLLMKLRSSLIVFYERNNNVRYLFEVDVENVNLIIQESNDNYFNQNRGNGCVLNLEGKDNLGPYYHQSTSENDDSSYRHLTSESFSSDNKRSFLNGASMLDTSDARRIEGQGKMSSKSKECKTELEHDKEKEDSKQKKTKFNSHIYNSQASKQNKLDSFYLDNESEEVEELLDEEFELFAESVNEVKFATTEIEEKTKLHAMDQRINIAASEAKLKKVDEVITTLNEVANRLNQTYEVLSSVIEYNIEIEKEGIPREEKRDLQFQKKEKKESNKKINYNWVYSIVSIVLVVAMGVWKFDTIKSFNSTNYLWDEFFNSSQATSCIYHVHNLQGQKTQGLNEEGGKLETISKLSWWFGTHRRKLEIEGFESEVDMKNNTIHIGTTYNMNYDAILSKSFIFSASTFAALRNEEKKSSSKEKISHTLVGYSRRNEYDTNQLYIVAGSNIDIKNTILYLLSEDFLELLYAETMDKRAQFNVLLKYTYRSETDFDCSIRQIEILDN